jgi:hypothetical protein
MNPLPLHIRHKHIRSIEHAMARVDAALPLEVNHHLFTSNHFFAHNVLPVIPKVTIKLPAITTLFNGPETSPIKKPPPAALMPSVI